MANQAKRNQEIAAAGSLTFATVVLDPWRATILERIGKRAFKRHKLVVTPSEVAEWVLDCALRNPEACVASVQAFARYRDAEGFSPADSKHLMTSILSRVANGGGK